MMKNKMLPKMRCKTCNKYFVPPKITSLNCSSVCISVHNRNKVLQQNRQRRKRVAERLKTVPKISCKTCGTMFSPINKSRINCSHKCALTYNYASRHKRTNKPQDGLFRKFTVGSEKDANKGILRDEINRATEAFLNSGGSIQKIEPVIPPKIPSVGSDEWNWEVQAGVGYYREPEELTHPEYVIKNMCNQYNKD